MSKFVIDIESSGLLSDMLDYSSFPYKLKSDAKLWCVVLNNIDTGDVISASNEDITKEWLEQSLQDCSVLIGHNIIKFDLIVLKLFGVLDYSIGYLYQPDTIFGKEVKIVDTLIVSRLLNPDRYLGHSLESWGDRLGVEKINFRKVSIEKQYITADSLKGSEFKIYSPEMLNYCIGDTETNKALFKELVTEAAGYKEWSQPVKMENKLADLAVRRENLGFWFDKKLAIRCIEDLSVKMKELEDRVDPILPEKLMNKGELADMTPPATQFLKDGSPSAHLKRFANRIGAVIIEGEQPLLEFEGKVFELPFHEPLKTHVKADINDLDHVKMHLINLGWKPLEFKIRDLTKDSKKQNIPYEKRVKALEKWHQETMSGKYKESRLELMDMKPSEILPVLKEKLLKDMPVRVPTSPCVRVGVEKELCPNLTKLGHKVDFANDFALYLTYKHRKACIAGGDIEDMDFEIETPNRGYLSAYREIDGRIPTPAIEVGAATNRYRHIGVANVPRVTSIYGKELRELFGSGEDAFEFGYDFSSLEARINGHYVMPYPQGKELADSMVAEKPLDLHSVNAKKLGISRTDAKSINYGILYGAQPNKIASMLKVGFMRGREIYNDFWDAVPALKQLKEDSENAWEETGKKYAKGIDGRRIFIRSKHSILNFLFQSAGVICAKYVNIFSMQYLEELSYCIDPFKADPDICEMISYHDEVALRIKKHLVEFKTFDTEEEAQKFVDEWQGHQLGAISNGKKWFVTLPSDISNSIDKAIKTTEKLLNLNVQLGFEYKVGKTWASTH